MDEYIDLTRKQIDAMTPEQLGQIVMCTNDGQGDTSVDSIPKILDYFEPEHIEGKSNSELIDMIYEGTNGNMTTCIWIEDSTYKKINFED